LCLPARTALLLFAVKRFALILACLLAAVLVVPILGKFLLALVLFQPLPPPPQPAFGFAGPWRYHDVDGWAEERPLPPAATIWQDYSTWTPRTGNKRRLYLARLGGADRQSAFQVSTNIGDTPMGAQRYTRVDFIYTDPTNGVYSLSWMLRGEHNPGFLRFDGTYRLFQLELVGQTDEQPPGLFIQAIEGMKPE
jgi:hypothetical protein